MPVHLLEINEQSLGKPKLSSGSRNPAAWVLLSRCETEQPESCLLHKKLVELGRSNKSDAQAALAALVKLIKVVETGQLIESFYDKKQSHPLHEFHYKGQKRVIWRIRKGDVRIAFYYAKGKVIFLADVFAKRKKKMTDGEKKQLEDEVKAYIDAEDDQQLVVITQQGE